MLGGIGGRSRRGGQRMRWLPTVVIKATFIPPATTAGDMSPATMMASNAWIIPITVPKNPSDGAIAMKSEKVDLKLNIQKTKIMTSGPIQNR